MDKANIFNIINDVTNLYLNGHSNCELYEMASCGHFDKFYLMIFMNDRGWIPHFHVFNTQEPHKATFDACIKIETAEYFKHSHHTDVLNSKQIKHLIKFLQTEKRPGLTHWQYIIDTWNENNSDKEIPYDIQMPDYTELIG